jgi:hypothetical protein
MSQLLEINWIVVCVLPRHSIILIHTFPEKRKEERKCEEKKKRGRRERDPRHQGKFSKIKFFSREKRLQLYKVMNWKEGRSSKFNIRA